MSYSSRTRDRYRLAVTAATGSLAAAAIAGTGWVVGAVAHDQAQQDAVQAEADRALARYEARVARQQAAAQQPDTVLRQRPTRTRVTTRYVSGSATTIPVGGGGTVSTPTIPSGTGGSSGGGSATPAPPTPPPPPPPPAPSSGS